VAILAAAAGFCPSNGAPATWGAPRRAGVRARPQAASFGIFRFVLARLLQSNGLTGTQCCIVIGAALLARTLGAGRRGPGTAGHRSIALGGNVLDPLRYRHDETN